MNNKIHAIDSSATPPQARAYGGPATVGVEADRSSLVQALICDFSAKAVTSAGGASTDRRTFVPIYYNAGAPTNGTTFAGKVARGSILVDTTNNVAYVNVGTIASPVYQSFVDSRAQADVLALASDVSVNASGTVQNTFYPLNTLTAFANLLSANGAGIEFEFAGTLAANANSKDFRLVLGATNITLVTGNTGNGVPFKVYGTMYRTGVGAQIVTAEIQIANTVVGQIVQTTALDETTVLTIVVQSQNTAAAAASATGKFAAGWYQAK